MADVGTLAPVLTAFPIAGRVKGVVGLGPPTVALALLAVTVGLPQAMTLLLVPAAVANFGEPPAAATGGGPPSGYGPSWRPWRPPCGRLLRSPRACRRRRLSGFLGVFLVALLALGTTLAVRALA